MSTILLFLGLGTQELILIALIVLLLFGAKRLPELMRGLGKGIKSFKKEMNNLTDEDEASSGSESSKKD